MNLLKRVLVAIIFIPVLLWVFYHGGWVLLLFAGLLSAFGTYELWEMYKRKGIVLSPLVFPIVLSVTFSVAVPVWAQAQAVCCVILLILSLMIDFRRQSEGTLAILGGYSFAMLYLGVLPGMLYRVSTLDYGRELLIFQLIAIWIADSAAYFIGVYFGKHPGIFPVSPKKTLEGTFAGVVFAGLAGLVGVYFFPQLFSAIDAVVITIGAGVVGPLGDLLESSLKRDAGVKDSSGLIPGHGGILDRFDSLLLAVAWLAIVKGTILTLY